MAPHQVDDEFEEEQRGLGLADAAADDDDVPRPLGQSRHDGLLGGAVGGDQRRRGLDAVLGEADEFDVQDGPDGIPAHPGDGVRIEADDENGRHAR
ncbi:hypothetical protein [Kitasatospora sp. NPDC018619]|uniref:hypothetical protein n=1 Tax=unclassified Kitasatospora TaxID=2633591 RepID=UPI0037956037